MISKERLEELIEQETTIYQVYADVTIIKMKLDKDFKADNAHLWKKLRGAVKSCGYPLYKLFETREEAEWYKEFGCVEITEKLCLPNFEELCKDLDGKEGEYVIADPKQFSFYIKKGFIDQILLQTKSEKFNWNLNKENYIYACKFAKRIFLGEK